MLKDVEKNVLQVLYNNRGNKPLPIALVRKKLDNRLDVSEVEFTLKHLKEKKLVRNERVPGNKTGHYKFDAYYIYEISSLGEQIVEADFSFPDKNFNHVASTVFIGETINFGTIMNIKVNIYDVVQELEITEQLRSEITTLINQIENETAKESINKSRIKELFKKVADKGISKLTDSLISNVLKQLIE